MLSIGTKIGDLEFHRIRVRYVDVKQLLGLPLFHNLLLIVYDHINTICGWVGWANL